MGKVTNTKRKKAFIIRGSNSFKPDTSRAFEAAKELEKIKKKNRDNHSNFIECPEN